MPSKTCGHCRKTFSKHPKWRLDYWMARRFCDRQCAAASRIGHETPECVKNKISATLQGRKRPLFAGKNNPFYGKKHTPRSMALITAANRRNRQIGADHWNWQGGRTKVGRAIRVSLEYKEWRKAVFSRDHYTCQECGSVGKDLNADHIKPFALYPELRFSVDNGRTLCAPCHRQTPTYGVKLARAA